MNKVIITMIILLNGLVYADSYSKKNILGVWEVSSVKPNGFVSFGKEFSKTRGEIYTLSFNKRGEVKNKTTNTVYNYEVVNGNLKIYPTKTYKKNYKIKDKRHYDLWKISKNYENCYQANIVQKKIPGYYRKNGYKWCKVQEYPKIIFSVFPSSSLPQQTMKNPN
ncbi:hypothetical protein [Sulfurimonas sp. ST-27]|uniref:hypothetical protein n=2 Tax=unclassified Sulfurimonas TaxID=2623549 RepID=UPI003AB7542D